ncbi:MAG: glycosyltransferase family 2 protein [Caulobacterales bacterium]|nr:glycosyltransferase family 2 protein [Caulobacterales bacterium]
MSVCVIVVSYRTGPALGRCLAALAALRGVDEIILVDNGNEAAEAAALSAFVTDDPRARLVRGQGNVGFAAGCNLAARAAQAEALLFLNPDAVLEAGAIENLSRALAAAPPPAIVGGDLRDADGRSERGSRRDRVTLWRAFVAFSGLSRLEHFSPAFRDFNRHADPVPSAPVAVQAVSGALLMLRRADFEVLGGFDEGYFVHVEDLDLCRRAEQRGWPVIFAPGPHGQHERSTSAVESRFIAKHKARGMARYLSKFANGPFERAAAWLAGGFIMLVSR